MLTMLEIKDAGGVIRKIEITGDTIWIFGSWFKLTDAAKILDAMLSVRAHIESRPALDYARERIAELQDMVAAARAEAGQKGQP